MLVEDVKLLTSSFCTIQAIVYWTSDALVKGIKNDFIMSTEFASIHGNYVLAATTKD